MGPGLINLSLIGVVSAALCFCSEASGATLLTSATIEGVTGETGKAPASEIAVIISKKDSGEPIVQNGFLAGCAAAACQFGAFRSFQVSLTPQQNVSKADCGNFVAFVGLNPSSGETWAIQEMNILLSFSDGSTITAKKTNFVLGYNRIKSGLTLLFVGGLPAENALKNAYFQMFKPD